MESPPAVREVKVLNGGYVRLYRHDGSDADIARAAAISYDHVPTESEPSEQKVKRLVGFLVRERHTSPLEIANITFEMRLPLFVLAHFVRHRTARLNVQSYRYTKAKEQAFVPEAFRSNTAANKQSSEANAGLDAEQCAGLMTECYDKCFETYARLLELGVAREQARSVLPEGAYTTVIYQMDLNNLLKMLSLRTAADAQAETQAYARAMLELAREKFPVVFEAWETHN